MLWSLNNAKPLLGLTYLLILINQTYSKHFISLSMFIAFWLRIVIIQPHVHFS